MTPRERLADAVKRGADPAKAEEIFRRYRHPQMPNRVRDEAAFTAEIEELLPAAAGAAEQLWLKGYDIVAIRPAEKRPFEKGWTQRPRLDREAARRIDRNKQSVGIRTGAAPGALTYVLGLDIDVTDTVLAAEITEHALNYFGPAPSRTGRAPKALLVYRTEEPLRKHRLAFTAAGATHAVELIATGLQFVAAGVHPDTQKPYTWDRELRPAAELTLVTSSQVHDYFTKVLPTWLAARGLEVSAAKAGSAIDRSNVDQAGLLAPSIDDVREVVGEMDNDTDYHDWVADLVAIKAAAGPDHEPDAFEIALDYSERHPEGSSPEELRAKWDTLRAPFAIGWSYLLDRARRQSINTAAYDFEVTQPSPEPEPASAASGVDPLPTEAERMVALTSDVESAFMAALPDHKGDPNWLMDMLQAAKGKPDPLAGVYSAVLNAALKVPSALHGVAFRAAVTNHMLGHAGWAGMPLSDKQLVLKAVEALLRRAPLGRRSPVILRDLPRREWLVDGLLARDGVGSITGAPNEGKSHLALHLAYMVAMLRDGSRVFGTHTVWPGNVFFFTSEGEYDLAERRKRLEAEYGPARLTIFGGVPDLSAPVEEAIRFMREALTLAGEKPDLVIFDVFAATIPGANENESWTVGAALQRARLLGKLFKCAVLVVHHAGKANPEDARGSSAFSAEVDVRLSVVAGERGIRAKVEKNRSGPKGEELWFHLSKEGILRPGPTTHRADEYDTDIGAAAVGRLVHDLGGATDALVKEHLAEQWPEHFGKAATGVRQRYSRVVNRALELKYIASAKGRLVPGDVNPPMEPGELDVIDRHNGEGQAA